MFDKSNAFVQGRVTHSPELRHTEAGVPVTNLLVAANVSRNNAATFHNFPIFGRKAEWICSNAGPQVGDRVQVETMLINIEVGGVTALGHKLNEIQILAHSRRRQENAFCKRYDLEPQEIDGE